MTEEAASAGGDLLAGDTTHESVTTEAPATEAPVVDGRWPSEVPATEKPAESETPAESALTADMFYDISKVPAEGQYTGEQVRGILKEAQGNYTQKTQAIAGLSSYAEQFGGVDKVQAFLDNFTTEEKAFDYVAQVVEAMGIPRDAFLKQIEEAQGATQEPAAAEGQPATDASPQYLTPEQAEKLFEERMAAREAEQKQLAVIESTIKELGVDTPEDRALLKQFAMAEPRNLDYETRLKNGHAKMVEYQDKLVEKRLAARQQNAANAPAPLNGVGDSPDTTPPEPQTWEEARKQMPGFLRTVRAERAGRPT